MKACSALACGTKLLPLLDIARGAMAGAFALFLVLSTSSVSFAGAPSPEVERGITWLQAQIQADGSVLGEGGAMATAHQVRSEVLGTTSLLTASPSAALVQSVLGNQEGATEYLARRLMAVSATDTAGPQLLETLFANQNPDGGFGGGAGYTSNPLDTGWALLAISSSLPSPDAASVSARALDYLMSTQQGNGSFSSGDQSEASIYSDVLVLLSLHRYAGQDPATTATARLLASLEGRRNSDGLVGSSSWMIALAYVAMHDFVAGEPGGAAIRTVLEGRQAANGSWADDPFTTALALRALALAAVPPVNPSRAVVRGQVVDGQVGFALNGATAILSGAGIVLSAVTEGGRFEFQSLVPGEYRLDISSPGYLGFQTSLSLRAGTTVDLGELRLSKGSTGTTGTVLGSIADSATGQPLAGAMIVLAEGQVATTSDASGNYQLTGVPAGSVAIVASRYGYAAASQSVSVVAGSMAVYSPRLARVAEVPLQPSVEGRVLDGRTNAPLANVSINVSGAASATAITDGDGRFNVTGLSGGGVVMLVASASGYDTVAASAQLYKSNVVTFSPRMYPVGTTPEDMNTTGIVGVVLDAGTNQPLVASIALDDGVTTRTISSGSDGRFVLKDIQSASVSLGVHSAGFQDASGIAVALDPLVIVDIGQVRLRRDGVSSLLPDLAVQGVSRRSATTNPQTLKVEGTVEVVIVNRGATTAAAGFRLLAFHDGNGNGRYDEDLDTVLGQTEWTSELAVIAEARLGIPVAGLLPFRDAPIHVWVDSANSIVELDESNNIGSTVRETVVVAPVGTLSPVVKWQWSGGQVIATPIVGPLVDTNGDGRVDRADAPVVLVVRALGIDMSPGILVALDGRDGHELWSVKDSALYTGSEITPALGDIDGDGKPEVVMQLHAGGMAAINNDGTLKWRSSLPPATGSYNYGGVTLADLDGDGKAEIPTRLYVLNHDGSLRFALVDPATNSHIIVPAVADLDGDRRPEILMGASAIHHDNTLYWLNDAMRYGRMAVADFDGDGKPEVVLDALGKAYMLNHDGTKRWGPVTISSYGFGGAPVIVDVDGDGVPEIGISGSNAYKLLNSDGSIRWSQPINDGSVMTGSSAFDLNGDGVKEIIYHDQNFLYMFDGKTGQVAAKIANSSATAGEYPIVADVDGDGHAEVVVPQNSSGIPGLRVFGDKNNSWVPTRRIWNEYNYHVTNVTDDGAIPASEPDSWLANNDYRVNLRTDSSYSDVTASRLLVADFGGSAPSILTARIGNAGAASIVTGLPVAFYMGDPSQGGGLLGVSRTRKDIAAGEYQDVSLEHAGALDGMAELFVVADDDGTGRGISNDFDRGNNKQGIQLQAMPDSFSVQVSTDRPNYAAHSPVALTALVANRGSFDGLAQVRFAIETTTGEIVEVLPLPAAGLVAKKASTTVMAAWNTKEMLVGHYRVYAHLVGGDGLSFARALAEFEIVATSDAAATSQLSLDKGSYNGTDRVTITSRAVSKSANAVLNNLVLNVVVTDPNGVAKYGKDIGIDQLLAGATLEYVNQYSYANAAAGLYKVTQTLKDSTGAVLDTQIKTYTVVASDSNGFGLTGNLTASPNKVPVGDTVSLSYGIGNLGNSAYVGLPLIFRIVDPARGIVLAEYPLSVDLGIGVVQAGSQAWRSQGADGDTVVAVLVALVGGKEVVLAQDSLTLTAAASQPIDARVYNATAARVLALVTCRSTENLTDAQDGQGENAPEDRTCAETRAQALRDQLAALGIEHTVVTTGPEFETRYRCGRYNIYWISGGLHKLNALARTELREAQVRGEGLIVDGVHDDANTVIDGVLGVTALGRQAQTDLTATIAGGGLLGARQLATLGRPMAYQAQPGAVVEATFDNGSPAIVGAKSGAGQSLTLAFNAVALIGQSDQGPLVGDLLAGVRSLASRAQVGDTVGLGIALSNPGSSAANLTLTATLPSGLQYDSAQPAPTSGPDAQGQLSWAIGLTASGTQNVVLHLKGSQAGSYDIPVQIGGSGIKAVSLNLHTDIQSQVSFAPAAQSAVNALAVQGDTDTAALGDGKAAVAAAIAAANGGGYVQAVTQWTVAAGKLRSLQTVGQAQKDNALEALSRALKADETRLCGQAGCITGTLGFQVRNVPATQVELLDTIVVARTIYNNCPPQIKDIPVNADLYRRRNGEHILNLWDNLTLNGYQNNRRDAGWQALGNRNDIVDVFFVADWQGVRLHLDRQDFRIVVTPPTLSGEFSGLPSSARQNDNLNFQRIIRNTGVMAKDIPIVIRVKNGDTELQRWDETLTLNANETNSRGYNWGVRGNPGETLTLEIIATILGEPQTLAQTNFTVAP